MKDLDPEIFDSLFHACALAAYIERAHAHLGWPPSDEVRERAYELYEQELAAGHEARPMNCAA